MLLRRLSCKVLRLAGARVGTVNGGCLSRGVKFPCGPMSFGNFDQYRLFIRASFDQRVGFRLFGFHFGFHIGVHYVGLN